MTLELKIDGEPTIFSTSWISGLMLRKAVQLKNEQVEQGLTENLLDRLVDFVCLVFNRQFTVQQFYEGLERKEIFVTVNNVILKVINGDYHTH